MNATIGRIVRYVEDGKEYAAIVSAVLQDDPLVDLTVFRTAEYSCPVHSVSRVAYDESGADGTWHWPAIERINNLLDLSNQAISALENATIHKKEMADAPVSVPPVEDDKQDEAQSAHAEPPTDAAAMPASSSD